MRNENTAKTSSRIQTAFLYTVFICYGLLLLNLLLLSRISLPAFFSGQHASIRTVNFIPFYSIWEYLSGVKNISPGTAFSNVGGNIIVFLPLGAFLALFKKDKRLLPNFLIVLGVSMTAEIIQGVFGIGAADVDDVILNCLGGFLGILGCKALRTLLGSEKNVRLTATIICALGLPYLLFLLFVV